MNLKEMSNGELVSLHGDVGAELGRRLEKRMRGHVDAMETVEHEGLLLRKVDRKCKNGDYVKVEHEDGVCFKPGKIYGPVLFGAVKADSSTGKGDYEKADVYNKYYGRDESTVDVFEVVEHMGKIPVKAAKSPNQQRAELIQRAREFVEEQKTSRTGKHYVIDGVIAMLRCNAEFIVNAKKRTVVCLLKGYEVPYIYRRGIAKCMPTDVFNADIGKAIALARALEIEIPKEFLQAVQPDEVVVGMIVKGATKENPSIIKERNVHSVDGNNVYTTASKGGWIHKPYTIIIDDTNAKYGDSK